MNKTFDAVKLVRDIRDKMFQKTKHMSSQELIQYYREAAKRVHGQRKNSKAIQAKYF